MAAVTSAVIAGVGVAASAYGSIQSANAANRAARAQQDAAGNWVNMVGARNSEAEAAYDKYSPQQQATIEKSIQAQERNVARSEALVNSIDPALVTAGEQMKKLLDGQAAPVLSQIKNQRDMQRNQVLDTLRQQMGPGAETSSLGQNMLMKFDSETANILNGAQQSYLTQVSNIAMSGGNLSSVLTEANKALASFGNEIGQIGINKANLIQGGTANLAAPMAAKTNAAGGEFKGDQLMGQMWSQLGAGAIQGAAYVYGNSSANTGLGQPQGKVDVGGSGMTLGQSAPMGSEMGSLPGVSPGKSIGTYGGGSGMSGNGPWSGAYVGGGFNQPQQQPNFAGNILGNSVSRTAGGY